jgi:hypothetical protein
LSLENAGATQSVYRANTQFIIPMNILPNMY